MAATAPLNPYATPSAELLLEHEPRELVLAEPGIRLVAVILDSVLIVACALPVLLVEEWSGIDSGTLVVLCALPGLTWIGASLVLVARHGQSLGKRVMKIRVLRADGSRAGLGRILFMRNLFPRMIGSIPLIGGLFGLLDACFIFRANRRCIHDEIAGTIVVKA